MISSVAPIHRLSDDDLTLIFLYFPVPPPRWQRAYTTYLDLEPDETIRSALSDMTWLHISHVCCRWRKVSSSCSLIWSTITLDSNSPELALALLERARQAPLSVFVHFPDQSAYTLMNKAIAHTADHLHHTRCLAIRDDCLPPAWVSHFSLLKPHSANSLEVLRLYTNNESSEEIRLPEQMFSGPTARLRQITLSGPFNFSFHNSIFSADLTHLSLSHVRRHRRSSDLFNLLARCPLQVLSLTASLPIPTGFTDHSESTPKDKLCLDSLKRCYIEDEAATIARFMRRVAIPPACYVSLHTSNAVVEAMDVLHSLVQISRAIEELCISRSVALHHSELHYTQDPGAPLHFVFKGQLPGSSHSTLELSLGGTADLAVFRRHPGPGRLDDVTAGVFVNIPLVNECTNSSIRELHIRIRCSISSIMWFGLSSRTALERINISGPCVYGFVDTLKISADSVLREVRDITLGHADLSMSSPRNSQNTTARLEAFLLRRKERDMLVPRITLSHCRVSAEQLAVLETASEQVVQCAGEPDIWSYDDGQQDE